MKLSLIITTTQDKEHKKICNMHKIPQSEKTCKISGLWYNVREGMSSAKIQGDKTAVYRRFCQFVFWHRFVHS